MIVGICKISLYIPHSRSLKEKRSVLRKIKDRFFSQFKLHLAEVDAQDLWQRAELGFAVVSNEKPYVESIIQKALTFLEAKEGTELLAEKREIIHF